MPKQPHDHEKTEDKVDPAATGSQIAITRQSPPVKAKPNTERSRRKLTKWERWQQWKISDDDLDDKEVATEEKRNMAEDCKESPSYYQCQVTQEDSGAEKEEEDLAAVTTSIQAMATEQRQYHDLESEVPAPEPPILPRMRSTFNFSDDKKYSRPSWRRRSTEEILPGWWPMVEDHWSNCLRPGNPHRPNQSSSWLD